MLQRSCTELGISNYNIKKRRWAVKKKEPIQNDDTEANIYFGDPVISITPALPYINAMGVCGTGTVKAGLKSSIMNGHVFDLQHEKVSRNPKHASRSRSQHI